MANGTELTRLHERLDDMFDRLDGAMSRQDILIAQCELCKPIVMGNGRLPISERVTKLEESRQMTKTLIGFILSLGAVVGTIAGAVGTIIGLFFRLKT